MPSIQNHHQSFKANFYKNQAFKDVVEYAEKTRRLPELDTALNTIKNIEGGDILLLHGKSPMTGETFSNFTLNKKTVGNTILKTPEESSFYGILELAQLGVKFQRLFKRRYPKFNINPEEMIEKYTVNNK